MKWVDAQKKEPLSDTHVLVLLHGKFPAVSYFFIDSFGHWYSSEWEIYDKAYDGDVTHWMPIPKLPNDGADKT